MGTITARLKLQREFCIKISMYYDSETDQDGV